MDATYGAELKRLSELDDYEIEEGYPDIRGWTLYDEAGRDIGEVTELLVDTSRDEVTWAIVDLDDKSWPRELVDNEENLRIPVTAMTFDEDSRAVRLTGPLPTIIGTGIEAGPAGTATPGIGAEPGARTGEGGTVEVVEERLDVEKARQKVGEVRIGKEIETETVRRQVPVEREEVIVEREPVERPIGAAEARPHLEGHGEELTIPIYREEVEITRRPVVTERLRIRKRMVQDTREVAAEVRKERVTVEGEGAVREVDPAPEAGPAPGIGPADAEPGGTLPGPEPGRRRPPQP